MENASKALIITGAILLGIMLLSMTVYLFSIFGGFSKDIYKGMSETQISEFNAQFTKFEGDQCRAHDVITVTNLAKQNNYNYGFTEIDKSNGSYYISVKVEKTDSPFNSDNFETLDDNNYSNFIKKYMLKDDNITPIYFTCKININTSTKLVNNVVFSKN